MGAPLFGSLDGCGPGNLHKMKFGECAVVGAWVIDPSPFEDDRGRFMRAWCSREFAEHGVEFTPLQANLIFSARKGTAWAV